MQHKAQLFNEQDIDRILVRIAHQIIEKNRGVENLALIGIKTRGVPLAKRLKKNIEKIEGKTIEVGELDITLYRDDLKEVAKTPTINSSDIPFSLENKTVVLVDDVIFTGRTARAALDAVLERGRAAKIQLCALIDRGHGELPIRATFVGKNIPTSLEEVVSVKLLETDGENGVHLYVKGADAHA